MAQDIKIRPELLHHEQQHRVGLVTKEWSYVEFTPGTYNRGTVVRDAKSSDLLGNSGTGTVTEAASIGDNTLVDTGEFANKDLRGAIGAIVEGTGIGQSFQVLDVKDANTLIIEVLYRKDKGWNTALDTTSKYRLIMPGRVYVGTTPASERARGVVQAPVFTVPTGEVRYGFVKQKGLIEGLVDADGTDLAHLVTYAANGQFVGTTSLVQAVGRSIVGDLTGSVDAMMPFELMIKNDLESFRYPIGKEQPYAGKII